MSDPRIIARPSINRDGYYQHDRDIRLMTCKIGSESYEDYKIDIDTDAEDDYGEVSYVGCYKEAVELIGNQTVVGLDGLTPATGDTYVVTDSGTPAAGSSDAVVAGSVAEWDGTQWREMVTGSGGFVSAILVNIHTSDQLLISPLLSTACTRQ